MADAVTTSTTLSRAFPGRLMLIAALAMLAILAVIIGPYVLDTYTVNILVRSFVYAATALTVDILWGYAGILTFGQAAFFGIGAYAAGIIFTYMDFSPGTAILALLAGLAVSALVAGVTGWISFFHGASPLYAAIVTLALPIILVQVIYSGGTFTGSSSGLVGYNTFDLSVEAWFTITGIGLVLLTVGAWFFVNSDFGRVLVAIRENEQRCTYLGIDAPRIKILLMVVMAMIASVAGYAYAGYTVVVAPEIGSFVFGTELVMWVALGGRGTLIGPVLGTVAIDLISAYLSGNLPFVWKLIVGTVFVLVIVALPQGILPVIRTGARRLWSAIIGREVVAAVAVPALAEVKGGRRSGSGSDAPALQVTGLSRSYGSLKVLEGVQFKALGSELLGIIGPNGAGKTTLMRCLSDGYERSDGTVAVFGNDIARKPPHGIVGFGIGRSFQTTSLFETLTVAECLRLARYRLDLHANVEPRAHPGPARQRATGHHSDRPRPRDGTRKPPSLARHEARAGAGHGAGAGAGSAAAGRAHRRPHQAGAHADRQHPRRSGPARGAVHPRHRARHGFRSRDLHAYDRAASGQGFTRRVCGRGGRLRSGALDLCRGAARRRAMSETAALDICGLSSGYGEAIVLRNVSLTIRPGEIIALLGKNGMGKSTLLKTVLGFLPAKAGSIRLFGDEITALPTYVITRRNIAYTPQEQTLFQDLSVEDNLRLGLRDDKGLKEGIARLSDYFPIIRQRLKQKAGTLSGGEQKMLIVSRALLASPRLIMIDEISEGLQPSMIQRLTDILLAERKRTGMAIFVVEQNVPFALFGGRPVRCAEARRDRR